MSATRWSPRRERERHDETVARVAAGGLFDPVWVLCPRESLRLSLEDRAARRGGGAFARFVDWAVLVELLEDRLSLPFAPPLENEARVAIVERALTALSATVPSLKAPLASDPFGVSLGLLSVVDTLRLHGWDGAFFPRAGAVDPADALVDAHVSLLGALVRAVEDPAETRGAMDLPARIARLVAALPASRASLPASLRVEGVDRLAPREAALLDALARAGCAVDVAPWVRDDADHALDDAVAPTLLDALDAGARRCAVDDPRALAAVRAGDVIDESDSVARWVAAQVYAGRPPESVAVWVPCDGAALSRARRAIGRYGLGASGRGTAPVAQSPLWQVVRASLRLGWLGVDVVDLATVLAAPGSGVWGDDRDRITSALRRSTPTSWVGVREALEHATEPAPPPDASGAQGVDDEPVDPARAARLLEVRRRVGALVDRWEAAGPMRALTPASRVTALRALLTETLNTFARPEVFGGTLGDGRAREAWLAASQSIRASCEVAMERWERPGSASPGTSPEGFLAAVEALLGTMPDGEWPPRGDGVQLIAGDAFAISRPAVLVVTGFHRGRFPSPVSRGLLMGALERERLASLSADLARLPSDATLGALATRDALRTLSLPTEKLVVVTPARDVDGNAVENALAWGDLLARLPTDAARERERNGATSAGAWCRELVCEHDRARALDAVARLGRGEVEAAARDAAPLAERSARWRDLFTARLRPDARFDLGALLRAPLNAAVYTPRGLESLMSCRYRFMAQELLGLRPLPLARRPSVAGRDTARVARAALDRLDESIKAGVDPKDADLDFIVQQSIVAILPWHDRPEVRLSIEELRRTVRGFLQRYVEVRRRWGADGAGETREDDAPVEITLDGRRHLKVVAPTARLETLSVSPSQSVAVHLTLGGTDRLQDLRDAGFDVDAALAPALLERATGREVGALVRLSLTRPTGDALTRESEPGAASLSRALRDDEAATLVRVGDDGALDAHAHAAAARIADRFDEVDRDDAEYAPHDAESRAELKKLGVKTCEYCAVQLGCRFDLAGNG
ncbi:MAG: hypothetical protein R3A52_30610 [Polyangiales bacterium]